MMLYNYNQKRWMHIQVETLTEETALQYLPKDSAKNKFLQFILFGNSVKEAFILAYAEELENE